MYLFIVVQNIHDEISEEAGGKGRKKEMIPQNQTGFRNGLGTVDNIFVLNYLANRQEAKKQGKLVAMFVNLRAAFDSVDRRMLLRALEKRGKEKG